MFHPYAFIRGQFEGDNKFFYGPNANILMSQQFYETDTRRDFYRGFTLQMVRNNGPAFSALELNWGEDHHKEFKEFCNKCPSCGGFVVRKVSKTELFSDENKTL